MNIKQYLLFVVAVICLSGCNTPPEVRAYQSGNYVSVMFNEDGTFLIVYTTGESFTFYYKRESADHYKIYVNSDKSFFNSDFYVYPGKAVMINKDKKSMTFRPVEKDN